MANNIIDDRGKTPTYANIKIGDAFLKRGEVFIKTSVKAKEAGDGIFLAVNMKNGAVASFWAGEKVVPVGVEIHLI